jgi:hypothetical protein
MATKADRVKSLRRKIKVGKLAGEIKKEQKHRVLFKGKVSENYSSYDASDRWFEIREYPPIKRTINYATVKRVVKDNIIKVIRTNSIQLPYQIFVFFTEDHYVYDDKKYYEWDYTYVDTYLAFARSRIKNKRSNVYFPSLPNMGRNFHICLGNFPDEYYDSDKEITPDRIVDYYWNSIFNDELKDGIVTLREYFKSFENWEKLSLKQVTSCLKWPLTITKLLKKAGIRSKEKYSIRKR